MSFSSRCASTPSACLYTANVCQSDSTHTGGQQQSDCCSGCRQRRWRCWDSAASAWLRRWWLLTGRASCRPPDCSDIRH